MSGINYRMTKDDKIMTTEKPTKLKPVEWDEKKIERLLNKNDDAVERALIVLLNFHLEKKGKGFVKEDYERGIFYGKWVKSGKHLEGQHLTRARDIVMKCTAKLAKEANEKAVARLNEFTSQKNEDAEATAKRLADADASQKLSKEALPADCIKRFDPAIMCFCSNCDPSK